MSLINILTKLLKEKRNELMTKVKEQYMKFDLICVHDCICTGKYTKHEYQNSHQWFSQKDKKRNLG